MSVRSQWRFLRNSGYNTLGCVLLMLFYVIVSPLLWIANWRCHK